MKILIVNWQDIKNPLSGGAEVHLHEIFKRIANMGHKVTLLCCKFKCAKRSEIIDGIEVIRFGNRYLFNFYVLFALNKIIKIKKPDILIEDVNKIPFFTPLYVRKLLRAIIFLHFFSKSIYKEAALPFALYVRLGEKLLPFIYKREEFVTLSESTKKELVENGISENKIKIIYCGIDKKYKPNFEIKAKNPLLLMFGRIKKYKCYDIGLRAMKIIKEKIPNAKLIVAGGGDYLPNLIKLAKNLSINGSVEFLGHISEKEKITLMQRAWVKINTSMKEGWGLTNIEANACGTPVIASNSPGLRDSIKEGVSGFLVNHGDVDELAKKIILVLQDNKLREKLSYGAIKWAKNFSWDNSATKMLEFINNILIAKQFYFRKPLK